MQNILFQWTVAQILPSYHFPFRLSEHKAYSMIQHNSLKCLHSDNRAANI